MDLGLQDPLRLTLIHAGHVAHPPGFVLQPRRVDRYVLFLVSEGSYKILLDNQIVPLLTPGWGVLIPPFRQHSLHRGVDVHCAHYYLHFTADPALGWDVSSPVPLFRVDPTIPVLSVAQQVVDFFPRIKPSWGCVGLLGYLLSLIQTFGESSTSHPRARATKRIADQVVELLRVRFKESITIADLAEELHLHPNYLSTQFQHDRGMSIMQFLQILRISRAKELLLTTDLPVRQIAYEVGFADPHYFSRVFSRLESLPPTEYIRRSTAEK